VLRVLLPKLLPGKDFAAAEKIRRHQAERLSVQSHAKLFPKADRGHLERHVADSKVLEVHNLVAAAFVAQTDARPFARRSAALVLAVAALVPRELVLATDAAPEE